MKMIGHDHFICHSYSYILRAGKADISTLTLF